MDILADAVKEIQEEKVSDGFDYVSRDIRAGLSEDGNILLECSPKNARHKAGNKDGREYSFLNISQTLMKDQKGNWTTRCFLPRNVMNGLFGDRAEQMVGLVEVKITANKKKAKTA